MKDKREHVDNFLTRLRLGGNLFLERCQMKLRKKTNPLWYVVAAVAVAAIYLLVNRPLPEYLVASSDLATGSRIEPTQVTEVRLSLEGTATKYLRPEEFHSGLVVTRPVLAGELIPASALSEQINPRFTQLVIRPSALPASQVRVGNRVAIWAASRDELAMPRLLVGAAEVTALIAAEGLFSDALPRVQVLIPRTSSGAMVQALASGNEIYLLPVG
jgi:hypothetical protein